MFTTSIKSMQKGLIVLMMITISFVYAISAMAADITTIGMLLTDSAITSSTGQEILFKTSVALAANDIVKVDMNDPLDAGTKEPFNVAAATNSDIILRNESQSTNMITEGTIGSAGVATCPGTPAANSAAVAYDATAEVVTVKLCATTLTVLASNEWRILTGTRAGGTNFVTTPGSASTNLDPVTFNVLWTDASASTTYNNYGAASIVANDNIAVTATVQPYLTTTFSANTCDLGNIPTISGENLADCGYNLTVSTNAEGGFWVAAYSGGDLLHDNGVATIDAVTGNAASLSVAGGEGYGVNTSDTGATLPNHSGCSSTGVPTATASIASAVGSLATTVATAENWMLSVAATASEQQGICHWAAGDLATTAGDYSQTVTHYTLGAF